MTGSPSGFPNSNSAYCRSPETVERPFVPSRRFPSDESVRRSVHPDFQNITILLSLQVHVPESEPWVMVPSGLTDALPPLNHDQVPGTLAHGETSRLRWAVACLCRLGNGWVGRDSSLPDCDLSVFPTTPPVE